MKVWSSIVPIVAFGLMGCSSSQPASSEERGSLSVALTGTASDGQLYRLRNADFEISGYPEIGDSGTGAGGAVDPGSGGFYSEVVSSEADPNAPVITRRLIPGYYYVNFMSSDWYIDRITPDGAERVEEVALLSPRFQAAYVYNGGTSDVVYRFGVDGQVIDFRNGELRIRVEIERPGDRASGGFGTGGWWSTAGSPGQGPRGGAFPAAGGSPGI
jgi:hypothetical protein